VISAAKIDPPDQGRGHGEHVRHGRRQPRRASPSPWPWNSARPSSRRQPLSAHVESAGRAQLSTPAVPRKHFTADSTAVDREFYDFYRTARGYHPNATTHPALPTNTKFMNFQPFADLDLVAPRPLLFIADDLRGHASAPKRARGGRRAPQVARLSHPRETRYLATRDNIIYSRSTIRMLARKRACRMFRASPCGSESKVKQDQKEFGWQAVEC
jgi:hypothetical protein